jgi:hypothetical protein
MQRVGYTLLLIFLTSTCSAQVRLYDSLSHILDSVVERDQQYRDQFEIVRDKYGHESPEMKKLFWLQSIADSINLVIVENILKHYGWLGADKIGDTGNSTLFIVIQHSGIRVQEKYLPLMRQAVKNHNASGKELALLEDRVALRQGKEQVYGSQVIWDKNTNAYYVLPVRDPETIDSRRAEVGLPPMEEYLKNWNTSWNIDSYKKNLPFVRKYLHDNPF